MEKCWANPLGNCGTKLSREHYVSESLWEGSSVDVVGLPWCKTEPRTIGLGSLTAKILCDRHNNELSPLDSAASNGFKQLASMTALWNKRVTQRQRKWKRVRYEVDGPLLERWFLKTAINLSTLQQSPEVWSLDRSPLAKPSIDLVRLAFGATPFVKPLGLYSAASIGEQVYFSDRLEAAPIFYLDWGCVAYLFEFRGLRFVLWLNEKEPPPTLSVPWGRDHQVSTRTLQYHLGYMNANIGGKLSHYVDFMWPDRKRPHWL